MIVLNPFLNSLCNFGFKNIGLTPGIPKRCFYHPQDVVTTALTQLILKRGLLAVEAHQNNVSYQSIEVGAGIRILDVLCGST